MIIKRLPIVLFCLLKASASTIPNLNETVSGAAVPSISHLSSQLSQMTFKDKAPEEQVNDIKPLLSPFEISEKMNNLIGTISTRDAKTAVEIIEKKLGQMLASGAALHDIAPIIGTIPIEARELVLAAIENKAYTILSLLQVSYIWRDKRQYHWFMALSYGSPWYDEEMWKSHKPVPMDWKKNLWAVCEVDNGALAATIQSSTLPKNMARFNEKLFSLCVEYDAVKVFEFAKFNLSQLEKHFKFLVKKSAVKLLKLYQALERTNHLHLEDHPFPNKLPASVDDFKFLLKNGYNLLPVSLFIKQFCIEGRLDLLIYLHTMDPKLIPDHADLKHATKGGWINIFEWAHQLGIITKDAFVLFCVSSMTFGHVQAFEQWLSEVRIGKVEMIGIYDFVIDNAIDAKILNILNYIHRKYPIEDVYQEWADSAARKCILPLLMWLYDKYKILPTSQCLAGATTDMLNWIKSKDSTLINVELVKSGHENIELLRWVFENAPQFTPTIKEHIELKKVCNKETMVWLNRDLGFTSFKMDWAYEIGDLEAIQWAKDKCGIRPTRKNGQSAAINGHFHVIYWMHKASITKRPSSFDSEMLRAAINYGNLGIADYLMLHFPPKNEMFIEIDNSVDANRYLLILKWASKHNFDFNPFSIMAQAAERGYFEAVKWLVKNFPTVGLDSVQWNESVLCGQPKLYKQLLEEYPNWRGRDKLGEDILIAFRKGSLELLQIILEKEPLLVKTLSKFEITKHNYHISRWLIAIGKWRD